MHWSVKALVQNVLSYVPRGASAYGYLQRKVLKSMPPDDEAFLGSVKQSKRHLDNIQRYQDRPLENIRTYEFGAGSTLVNPMTYYMMGVNEQVLTDVSRIAHPALLKHTVEQFNRLQSSERKRLPNLPLEEMGIRYLAPASAIQNELGQFDAITTTSVLEHIPPKALKAILSAMSSMLSPTGIMVNHVDYSDHYGIGDANVSRYNFLRYSDVSWALINSPMHYQNRLRHSDYVSLFKSSGFEILSMKTWREEDPNNLNALKIHRQFEQYGRDDLSLTHGYFILRPCRSN